MNVSMIRPWLYVGNREECNQNANEYDGIIHLYRDDYPDHSCFFISDTNLAIRQREGSRLDWIVEYKDGESLPQYHIDGVISFVRKLREGNISSRLLVHCAAGQTRSPTVALLILSLVERVHPFMLLDGVYSSIWQTRGKIANICHAPLGDIVEWYEEHLYDPELFGEATAAIKSAEALQ